MKALPPNLRVQAEAAAKKYANPVGLEPSSLGHAAKFERDCMVISENFLAGASWLYQTLVQMPEGFKTFLLHNYDFPERRWRHIYDQDERTYFDEMKKDNPEASQLEVIDIAAIARFRAMIARLESELTTKDQRIKELESKLTLISTGQSYLKSERDIHVKESETFVAEATAKIKSQQERIKELEEALKDACDVIEMAGKEHEAGVIKALYYDKARILRQALKERP
jgi:hypothetical protein